MSKLRAQRLRLGDYFAQRTESGREGLPTLSVTLRDGLILRDDLDRKTGTSLEHHEHLLAREGDIAYNMMRMWQGASGRAATDGLVSPAYVVLSPTDKIDSRFAAHWFKSPRMIYLFWAYSHGLTEDRLRLYYDDFAEIPAAPPQLSEQRRIAAVLDEWDYAIATVEKLGQSQQRRKGGLIKSVFFGDANWFDASVSELADVVGGGTLSTNKRAYWDGDIPWCTPTDITGLDTRYIEATERTISETGLAASNASLLPVGSIILCSRASVGECAINLVPMATNQGFQSLVPKDQNDRYFLYYLVQAYKPELIRLSAGSTFMEFPKSALRAMNIRIPEAEKRQEVGLLFNDVDDELDQTVALLKSLRLQKRGLMQKLLTGDRPVPASIDRLLPGGPDVHEAIGTEVQHAEAAG